MSMICTPDAPALDRAAPRTSLFDRAKRIILWPLHVAQARRELAMLARFSEYELHDIGLTSQDLRNATALPLDVDPTHFLAGTVAANARSRRSIK